MNILVTGAAGFIGSHLVDYLLHEGHIVFGVDDLSGGFNRNISPQSFFTKLDLRKRQDVYDYIKKIQPELVFHLAADATEGRSQFTPISAVEKNTLAYTYLLTACIKERIAKLVLISSMSVYGNQMPPFSEDMLRKPDDIYGVTKSSMEAITEILSSVHRFAYSIVRPHNVYGPRQNISDPYRNVIGIFINCLLQNKPYYIYGEGNQKRAFTYIDDLIPPLAKVGFLKKANGEIINLGPEKEYSINELSDTLLKVWFGTKPTPKRLAPKYAPLRPKEILDAFCTSAKAKKLLSYQTKVTLEEGLTKMIHWAKTIGPVKFRYQELELTSLKTPAVWKHKKI